MGEKDHEREREYSPNPDFVIGKPANEDPDRVRTELYQYHKRAGSLGAFYAMYPPIGRAEEMRRTQEKVVDRDREQERGRER